MVCPQDPDLLAAGVQIDRFAGQAAAFLLTHAHLDHMKSLSACFPRSKAGAKIWCTRTTKALVQCVFPSLTDSNFRPVAYGTAFHPVPGVTAFAMPSYHCPGSCMFLFELAGGRTRVLYSGDFRFDQSMRANPLLTDFTVSRLYYDDTFDAIEAPFPSYQVSLESLVTAVSGMVQRYGKVRVNVSILGLEPLLEQLATGTGFRLSLSKTLVGTWRGRQLSFLLGNLIGPASQGEVILSHRRTDPVRGPWVVPTCTSFLCNRARTKARSNVKYVWFCTHSNRVESDQFKALVGAAQVNPCGERVGRLKC